MPQSRLTSIVRLIERRRARRARQRRAASRRIQTLAALLLGALSVALAIAMLVAPQAYDYLTRDLPALETLPLLFDPQAGSLLQPTIFYDRNGQELWRLEIHGFERQFTQLDSDSPLAAALVAAFDPDYWEQPLFSLDPIDSVPSIAAQLVQEFLFRGDESGWLHAVRLRLLAARLTEAYGREQVLSWFANSRVFGHYAVGVEAAAQLYFGGTANELTLAEAALLAPVAQAPAINPIDAPQLAVQRQQALLLEMLDAGLAGQAEVTAALVASVAVQATPALPSSTAPDFTALALEQAQAQLGFERVQRGGLAIHTSLDFGLQQEMGDLLADQEGAQALVLDPVSGQVLAMLGRADLAQHAPGSLLSPFAYLSAFARGQAPASLAWDAPSRVLDELGEYANPAGSFHGPVSLRQALANDYLVVSLQVLDAAGAENAWSAARQSGLDSWSEVGLDGLLGTGRASLLEAAQAFGTLANLGARQGPPDGDAQPVAGALLAITGPEGEDLLGNANPSSVQVLAPELAYLVTDVISDVSVHGDEAWRQALAAVGRPAALQLGRAQGEDGLWAIGYSPQRVVALWLPETSGAASLWSQAFQLAHNGLPIESWPTPAGLASAIVCVPGGGLPGPDCPETRRELFLAGDLPTTVDELYQRVAVNQQSGRLATVFSPTEFIEEELVLNAPDDVADWARGAGLPVAPADYDSVLLPAPEAEAAAISAPAPFSAAQGLVSIRGRTGSEGLSYRVLVGRGLYPQQWTEIGQGGQRPEDSLLAAWDTSGLSGAWAIQLQVLGFNGSLERTYTLVTLDQ